MINVDLECYDFMMGDVIGNLKNEIAELTSKVKQARDSGNWGTYKNLILAYKEIINLYKDITLDIAGLNDKTQTINNNMNIKLDKKTLESIYESMKRTKDNQKNMYIQVFRRFGDPIIINDDTDKITLRKDIKTTCSIYFDGKSYHVHNMSFSDIADIVAQHELDNTNIYLDDRGIGQGIADELDSRDIKYTKLGFTSCK